MLSRIFPKFLKSWETWPHVLILPGPSSHKLSFLLYLFEYILHTFPHFNFCIFIPSSPLQKKNSCFLCDLAYIFALTILVFRSFCITCQKMVGIDLNSLPLLHRLELTLLIPLQVQESTFKSLLVI